MSTSSASPAAPRPTPRREAWEPFDGALGLLADRGPNLRNGLTSHLPMVAEALCALDRPEAVMPWVRRHRGQALPWPAAVEPLGLGSWRGALGRPERATDWRGFFRAELTGSPWRRVLRTWSRRLAPGLSAAALHGLLRTGHVVRALGVEDTVPRRSELGDALATWAAWYQELPGRPGSEPLGRVQPREALAYVTPLAPEKRRYAGSIVSSLEALGPDFAPVIDFFEPQGEVEPLAWELGALFSEVFLASAHDPLSCIVFTHGVTGFGAISHLARHLGADMGLSLLRYGWQAACGLYVAFGTHPIQAPPEHFDVRAPEELAERAVGSGDDHAIKLTEACLGLHARLGSSAPLAAAHRALTLLPPA